MPILIYIFPTLIDMVVAQIVFVNTVRAAQMGLSDMTIAGLLSAFGVCYTCGCPVVGRFLTTRNAAAMLMCSCGLYFVVCMLFLVANSIVTMYILTGLAGIAGSFFFPSFQVFMKAVDTGRAKPVPYSVGLYTFSWSAGFAVGPFFSGFLMETGVNGWMYCYGVSAVACLCCAVGIWLLKHHARAGPVPVATPGKIGPASDTAAIDYGSMPDLAWLGWIGAGMGVFALTLIRGLFPALAVKDLALPESTQGMVFFLLCLVQSLTGLVLCRSRLWMYRPIPVLISGILGAVGVLCFAFGRTSALFYLGAVCFGLYSGSFFFYLVFHALAHPSLAPRYIAANETLVGMTGILGPLFGGLVAQAYSSYTVPFGMGAGLVLITVVFQCAMHVKFPARVPG